MKKLFTISCLFLLVSFWQLFAAAPPQNLITLDLTKSVNPASFSFDPVKGNWTETYNDEDYTFIQFNNFSLSHLIGGPGASFGGYYWDGFTVCTSGDATDHGSTGSSDGWLSNQWGCMAGGGIKTDTDGNVLKNADGKVQIQQGNPYLVAYWGYYTEKMGVHCLQTKLEAGKAYRAVGVYVNNHPWPYYGNIHGDGFARKLDQEGDFVKLIIHGMDKNHQDNGKSVTHYLAKYEDGVLTQSPDWVWVDLSSLGEIGGVYYTMETTDADPIYGPNTAVYFCMDKFQVMQPSNISLSMNSLSQKVTITNKVTGEAIDVGAMQSGYKYSFTAYPGTYTLQAYQSDGITSNGTIEFTVTDNLEQSFQFSTITTGATNSGWTLGEDYTVSQVVSGRDGTIRTTTLGSSTTANRATFLAYVGDTYFVNLIPNATHTEEGYMPFEASGTINWNVTKTGAIPMGYNYTVTVPEGANAFIGKKTAHFVPFTEIMPTSTVSESGNAVYTYRLADGQEYNYRISQTGKVTNAGIFKMSATLTPLVVSQAKLDGDPKQLDRNLQSNNKYNQADIYLNVNETGYLKLNTGETFQLVNIRCWQTINTVTGNYFIEPDFHYTVLDENGVPSNAVLTIDSKGKITAQGNGTAIVLVTYDAINVESAVGGPFFGAIWPENTGVFVVSVGNTETTDIVPNMTVNATLNTDQHKLAGANIDAELDVFYYLENVGGYNYTFTPSEVATVTMAQPAIGDNSVNYSGFTTSGVTANKDGSYTLSLINGKNIVKLTDANGVSVYQVLRAKPLTYTVSNITNPGADVKPGDEVSVRFNTIYHPANKLSGVYNMSPKIVYQVNGTTVSSKINQYAFAATDAAQTISATIPSDWDVAKSFDFTDGVINVRGWGDPYGGHRDITYTSGKNPNFTAVQHESYFGVLPTISIPVADISTGVNQRDAVIQLTLLPNPATDVITLNTAGRVAIYSITGTKVYENQNYTAGTAINVSSFTNGIYMVKTAAGTCKLVKK